MTREGGRQEMEQRINNLPAGCGAYILEHNQNKSLTMVCSSEYTSLIVEHSAYYCHSECTSQSRSWSVHQ